MLLKIDCKRFVALYCATSFIVAACSPTPTSNRSHSPQRSNENSKAVIIDDEANRPACTAASVGAVIYVSSEKVFQVCEETGWSAVRVSGEPGPAGEPGEPAPSVNDELREVWRNNIDSAVFLKATYGGPTCTGRIVANGTGFIVGKDLIATNAHVASRSLKNLSNAERQGAGCATNTAALEKVEIWYVQDSTRGNTLHNSRNPDALVTRLDDSIGSTDDISILQAPTGERKAMTISAEDESENGVDLPGVRFADDLLLIGFTRGNTFAHFIPGTVHAMQPATNDYLGNLLAIGRIIYQINFMAGRGASGGPILDLAGEVIGINFAGDVGTADTQFSYAARIKPLRDFLTQTRQWFVVP